MSKRADTGQQRPVWEKRECEETEKQNLYMANIWAVAHTVMD